MANEIYPVSAVEDIYPVSEFVEPKKKKKGFWDSAKQFVQDYATENFIDGPVGIEMGLPVKEAQGLAEGVATTATGLGAFVPAGVYMAGALIPQKGRDYGEQLQTEAKKAMAIQEALTYTPKTEGGQAVAGAIASPFTAMAEGGEKAGKFFDALGEKAQSNGSSEEAEVYRFLGFLSRTGGEAAPFLLPIIPKLGKVPIGKIAKSEAFIKAKEYAKSVGADISTADAAMRERVLGKMPEDIYPVSEATTMPSTKAGSMAPEGDIYPVAEAVAQPRSLDPNMSPEGGYTGALRPETGNAMISDIRGGATNQPGKFAGRETAWDSFKDTGANNGPGGEYADYVAKNLLEWEKSNMEGIDPSQFELKKQWDTAVVRKMYELDMGEPSYDRKTLRKYLDTKVKDYNRAKANESSLAAEMEEGMVQNVERASKPAKLTARQQEVAANVASDTTGKWQAWQDQAFLRNMERMEQGLEPIEYRDFQSIPTPEQIVDMQARGAGTREGASFRRMGATPSRMNDPNAGVYGILSGKDKLDSYTNPLERTYPEGSVTPRDQAAMDVFYKDAFFDNTVPGQLTSGTPRVEPVQGVPGRTINNEAGARWKEGMSEEGPRGVQRPKDFTEQTQARMDAQDQAFLVNIKRMEEGRPPVQFKNMDSVPTQEQINSLRERGVELKVSLPEPSPRSELNPYQYTNKPGGAPSQYAWEDFNPPGPRFTIMDEPRPIVKQGPGGNYGPTFENAPKYEGPLPGDSLIPEIRGGSTHDVGNYAGRQSREGGSAINLSKIDTEIGVKRIMDAKAREMEAEIGRRTVPISELWEQGKALDWDAKEAVKQWETKKSFTPAEALAVRQLNINAMETLYKSIQDLPPHVTTLPAAIREQYMQAMSLMKVTSQAATEAGRLLRIHGEPVGFSGEFAPAKGALQGALKQMKDMPPENIDVLINKIRNIDPSDTAAIERLVNDGTTGYWSKKSAEAYELYLNILLSNPLTSIRNIMGNSVQLVAGTLNRAVSGAINQAGSKLMGRAPERYAAEAWHEMAAIKDAVREGLARMKDVWKNGENWGALDASPTSLEGKSKLYQFFNTPLRTLGATDAFFKGVAETGDLHATAYRAAKQKGLSGQAMLEDMVQSISRPTPEMLDSAVKKGKESTFQQDLPKFVSSIITFKNKNAFMATQMPFVKTPFNIITEGVRYLPTSLAKYLTRDLMQVKSGKMSFGEWTDKVAKPLGLGIGVTTAVALLAAEGRISGSGPNNKNKKQELIQSGWQPYSVKIGDSWYSYRSFEPFATTIGITADIANGYFDENTEDSMAGIAANAIKNNVLDKSFLKNIADLLGLVFEEGTGKAERWARNYAGSWVPAVVGGAERAMDDQFRDVQSIPDAVMSRIPILAENVTPKLSVWGEEMKRQGSGLERGLSPIARSQEKSSPVEQALLNMPKHQIGYPSREVNGVKLEPEEYWQLVRDSRLPAKRLLDMYAQQSSFKRMDDDQKMKFINKVLSQQANLARRRKRDEMMRDGRLRRNTVGHFVAAEEDEE